MSNTGDRINRYKVLAAAVVAFGLLGFPLGVFVAADGAGLVALGVYATACVLIALGAALWVSENIVDGATEAAF